MMNQSNYNAKKLAFCVFILMPFMLTAQFKFTKNEITGGHSNIQKIILLDIDGDTNIDIVTSGNDKVYWFKNDGSGNFTRSEVYSGSSTMYGLYVIDLDGDGHMDILSASTNNDEVAWHKNSGTNPITWTKHVISSSAEGARSVYAIDMDGDTHIDVLSASPDDGKIAWYENSGTSPPAWTEHQVGTGLSADQNVTAGDLDNDGLVDVIASGNDLTIFNKGNASPTDFTTNIIQTGVNHSESMTVLNFDSDGDLDIVSGRSTNRISIWENTGSLNFTRHDIHDGNYNFIYEPKAVYPIDMDNQNGKDIIIASRNYGGWAATQGNSDRVSIYFNDGSYNFTPVTILRGVRADPNSRSIGAADLDNDGDIDVVVAGRWDSDNSKQLFWLENEPDNTPATIDFVTAEKPDGTYGVGDIIPIEVHFSRYPIDITGTPQLTLDVGAGTKTINRVSIRDSIMSFHYTVEAGQNIADLDNASGAVSGGTIKSFNTDVNLTLPVPGSANSLAGKKNLVIDTTAPTVNSVSSTKTDGTYGPGEVIPITVEFDDDVEVVGPLTQDAEWTTNSGHHSVTIGWQSFTAVNTGRLREIEIELQSPLRSRSAPGTLKIYAGEGNSGTELSSQAVTLLDQNNTWKKFKIANTVNVTAGQQYTWEISIASSERGWLRYFNTNLYAGGRSSRTASEEWLFRAWVEVTDPDLELTLETGTTNDAVVDYTSGSGTNTLTFNYTVATVHTSSDLDYESTSSLVLNSGTVKDAGKNDASPFVLASPGTANSLGANKNINLDSQPPTVTFDPGDGVTGVDLDKVVTLTFNDNVRTIAGNALTNDNVDAMFDLKTDDANGAIATTGIDASWDAANNRISIAHDNFASEQLVYAALKANMVEDIYNNPVAAASVTFTAKDALSPTVTFSPDNGVSGVSLSTSITISFDEAVRNIVDSAMEQTLDDSNVGARITLKEDNASGNILPFVATINTAKEIITINPDNDFAGEQDIFVCIDDQVEDFSDNAISQTCVTFTTEDVAAPIVILNPADGDIDVPIDAPLVVTFNEMVRNINGSALDDINVQNLIIFKEDFSDNAISQTCVTFTTEDVAAPIVNLNPDDGDIDVPIDAPIIVTFNEMVRNTDQSALDDINVQNLIIFKQDDNSGAVLPFSASVRISRERIDIVPDNNFTSEGQYYFCIEPVQDFSGNATSRECATFTAVDASAPIITIDPANSATNVDVDKTIKIASTEALRRGDNVALDDSNVDNFIVLKENSASGTNIAYDATINATKDTVFVDPTSDFNSEQTVYVEICCVEDGDDNIITTTNSTFTTADVDPPTVTFDPANAVTDVPVDKTISLAFSEAIRKADDNSALDNNNVDGFITLKKNDASGDDILFDATINATKDIISVDPTSDFNSEQRVYVAINDQVVEDDADNAIDLTSAIFTVEDTEPPTITFFPVDAATGVPVATIPTITFNEPVQNIDNSAMTNNNVDALITFKDTDASGADISMDATINAANTVVTLTPTADFASEKDVFMCVDPVADEHGNQSIQQCATFKTSDVILPTVTWDPPNGSIDVSVSKTVTLTFSEAVRNANNSDLTDTNVDGLITLKYDNAGGDDISFDATIDIDKKVISVDPTDPFKSMKTVYAAIAASVEDDQNNAILATSTTFIVADSEPPTVAFTPSDGTVDVPVDTQIKLTFSEPVRLINGTDLDNDNVVALVTVEREADGNKEGFDAVVSDDNTEVTLTLNADLESEQMYNVSIGSTVEDVSDNALNAANAKFTTTDAKPPSVTFNPADGDTDVSVTTDITVTFDEAVRYLDASALTNDNVDTLITLKNKDGSGVDLSFDATINAPKTQITIKPGSVFRTGRAVYVAIKAKVEDDMDNAIEAASAIFNTEETPEINVSAPSVAFTTEAGGKSTFSLTLGKEPTANVVVAIMSQDESEGKVSTSGVTFTKQLWNESHEIEVVGQDDFIDDGDVSYLIGIMGVVSDDSRYNGVDPDDVLLINKDDSDKAGITVTPYRGLVTTEAGAKDSFSVKLESEPVADLTIALDKTKLSEGSLSSDTLIFTPANWGTLQQVIVTGLNDLVVDGDKTYKIITRKPVSDDSLYTTINPDDIIVTNHAREPIMVVPVDSLDFGLVARDGYNVKTFDVVNAGTDTLRVSDGTINSQAFIASATEFKVAPRDTFQVYIQFLGESAIYYAALFKAKHNDTSRGDLKIKLKGEAFKPTIAAVDTVVDFGRVYVFFDEERELSVYNAGNSDLRIDSLVTSGDQFSVGPSYTSLLPMYLKPSDSTSVTVVFSSPDSGEARENLRIFSNDQDRPRFDVPIVATILPPDTVGPSFEIISITPEEALLKQFISVETELKDATEVEEAVLYFLEGGQTEFTAYPMITEDQETFEFVSRPADVTMNGIAFYMLARDQRGNFALSDTFSPPVKFRDGSLQTTLPNSAYGDGVPKKKWRLISVPAELEDPNVVNTLGDELDGKPNSRKWRIFEPENSGGGGSGWKQPEELSVGKGYWLIQAIDERAVLSTGAGKTISLTGYDMTLEPGWNMISSPYAFPMTPNLDGASFYGPLTYGNGSEGWSEESTMLPWSGYLIYNRLSEVKTVQLAPLDFSSESNTQTLARERSDGEWMLQFKAEGANYSDTGNILGRKIDAEEGLDHFDNPEPPYMDKFVSVTLEPDNPFFKKHSMTSDIRSSFVKDGIWNVALHTRGEKGPIEVSHDLFGAFPSEDAMVMLDMTTRNQYNLLEEQKVEIIDYSEDFPYRFKIFAGSPEFVASAMADALSLLPDEFTLRQNYPNPFNPSTTIEFALPNPTEVSLVIYNLMGQEVRTLKRGMMDTGHHSILWHGKDNKGQPVSSGVYLVRFRSHEWTASHKMLMLK